MNGDRLAVLIIFGFHTSFFIANFIILGPVAAGNSMTYSLVVGPIVYGVYKLIKYLYNKSKTIKAAV